MDSVKVYFEPRDVWVGYYRGDTHHYVCPLPCLVIRWKREDSMSRGYFDQHGNYVPHQPVARGPVCPECEVRKHQNCNGQAWDDKADAVTACVCWVNAHLDQGSL